MPLRGVTSESEDVFADMDVEAYVPSGSRKPGHSDTYAPKVPTTDLSQPPSVSATRSQVRASSSFDHDADFVALRSASSSPTAPLLQNTKTRLDPANMLDLLTDMEKSVEHVRGIFIPLKQHLDAKTNMADAVRREELPAQFLQMKKAGLSLHTTILKMRASTLQGQPAKAKKRAEPSLQEEAKKVQHLYNTYQQYLAKKAAKAAGKRPAMTPMAETEEMDMDSIKREVDAVEEPLAEKRGRQRGDIRSAPAEDFDPTQPVFTQPPMTTHGPLDSLQDVWLQEGHGGPGTLSWLLQVFKQHGPPMGAKLVEAEARIRDCPVIGSDDDRLTQEDLQLMVDDLPELCPGADRQRNEQVFHSVLKADYYQRLFDEEEAQQLRAAEENMSAIKKRPTSALDTGEEGDGLEDTKMLLVKPGHRLSADDENDRVIADRIGDLVQPSGHGCWCGLS